MEEAYVSYEVAKLLKEKGFNNPCHAVWNDNRIFLLAHLIDNKSLLFTDAYKFSLQKESLITIPTHQMACAWLREKNISIFITDDEPLSYKYTIKKYFISDKYEVKIVVLKLDSTIFMKYEDAVESAIKYCLENLI